MSETPEVLEEEASKDAPLAKGHLAEKPVGRSWAPIKIALAISNLALLTGVIALAYALDTKEHEGRVVRNVTLAGQDVSGFSRTQLETRVVEVAENYRTTSLIVDDGEVTFSIPTRGIEMEVQRDETVAEALELRRDGNPATRFLGWAFAFASPTEAEIEIAFEESLLAAAIRQGDQGERLNPIEPRFEVGDGRLEALEGINGRGIDPGDAVEVIDDVATGGTPLKMSLTRRTLEPKFSLSEAEDLAEQVEATVLRPIALRSGEQQRELNADALRPLISTRAGEQRLEMAVDSDSARPLIEKLFVQVGRAPREPAWTVVDNRPQVSPGENGTTCCDPSATTQLEAALQNRLSSVAADAPVEIGLREVEPKTTAEEIPRLGIQEDIGSFTTNFEAGQPRVVNIKRISDLVRGAVIEPGETFSLNRHVGPRTPAKGFVEGGVIQNGEFAESVGGGISQFATTLFNASFFGGLDFGEYQAHTIYISRYPYGREATISFPHPDLEIKNTTPHGVLIWLTYTDSSVTVTLYSTRYATGTQTGQTTAPRGQCTRVTTERTRTYVDGRKATDTVSATYQPEEGKTC